MSIATLDFDDGPRTTSRISLVSSSGKRMHPRVDRALTVSFADGRQHEVLDWSISGFSLADGSFAAAEGTIHRVELIVPLAGCGVAIEADAKVTRVAGPYARGFRFIGLSPERARVIDHFIRNGIDGETPTIDGLPPAFGGPGGDVPRRRGRLLRDLGQVARLAALAGVVACGGAFVAARFLTVGTDYAAVAADLQQLHAPEAGYLVGERLAVGSRVRAGERIGSIQPIAGPQARLSTETQVAGLQAGLEQQKLALGEASAGFATFLQAAQTDFVEATANRQMLEMQIATQERSFRRLASLKAKDVVGQGRVDGEEQALLALRRELSAAKTTEEAARQKLANAEAGRFSSDGRSTQKSPADLRQDIAASEATIARLRDMLAGLDQPLPILSPCDCRVAAIGSTPGTYVLAGTRLADLVRDGGGEGATTVDALVQNPRLNLVREGQPVTVYLADRADGLSGRVVGINFNPGDTGRSGLPPALRTLDDYGLMTVRLDQPVATAAVGLPASVTVPVTWAALSARIPAASWAEGILDRMVARARSLLGHGAPMEAGKTERLPPAGNHEPV